VPPAKWTLVGGPWPKRGRTADTIKHANMRPRTLQQQQPERQTQSKQRESAKERSPNIKHTRRMDNGEGPLVAA